MTTNEAESPLDSDEPHTPAWLTWLGIGLFTWGGIYLLASGDDAEEPNQAVVAETPTAAEDEKAAPSEGQPSEDPTAAPPLAAPDEPADPHAGHNH